MLSGEHFGIVSLFSVLLFAMLVLHLIIILKSFRKTWVEYYREIVCHFYPPMLY